MVVCRNWYAYFNKKNINIIFQSVVICHGADLGIGFSLALSQTQTRGIKKACVGTFARTLISFPGDRAAKIPSDFHAATPNGFKSGNLSLSICTCRLTDSLLWA